MNLAHLRDIANAAYLVAPGGFAVAVMGRSGLDVDLMVETSRASEATFTGASGRMYRTWRDSAVRLADVGYRAAS